MAWGSGSSWSHVKCFHMKLDQLSRGKTWKKRGSRPGVSYRTITLAAVWKGTSPQDRGRVRRWL